MAKIDNIFVLMLENRSFDHLLAFSGLTGVSPPPPKFGFAGGAQDKLSTDPPHEFEDVAAQIGKGKMDGFAKSSGPEGMKGFDAGRVPVLVKLAADSLLMDNWYSSLPGPTWPNRLFAHAGSSGGLDNSPGPLSTAGAVTFSSLALKFDNGHIFSALTGAGKSWRIYHGDTFPQVLSLEGMVSKKTFGLNKFFRPLELLAADLSDKKSDTVNYTFIEPNYDLLGSYKNGSSQHPRGTVKAGEDLIQYVYNAIFTRKVGSKSALIITWDEHGGFFDHVTPPESTPPGDSPRNANRASKPMGFKFDTFGVRVPALIISPWIASGLGSDVFGKAAAFDHSSIVRGVMSNFGIAGHLTARDKSSPDWTTKLLSKPRTLAASFAKVAAGGFRFRIPEKIEAEGPPDGNVNGTAQIAYAVDWALAEQSGRRPLALSELADKLKPVQRVAAARQKGLEPPMADSAVAHRSLLEYIGAVAGREQSVNKLRAKQAKGKAAAPAKRG